MKTLKAYIVYSGNPNSDNTFYLIAENGWCIASHLCSNLNWARSDLFDDRPERKLAFEKIGINLEITGSYEENDPILEDLVEKNKNEDNYKELSEQFSNYYKV